MKEGEPRDFTARKKFVNPFFFFEYKLYCLVISDDDSMQISFTSTYFFFLHLDFFCSSYVPVLL